MDATAGRRVDRKILFLHGRNVFGWQGRAFAKEILFHLFHDHFLIFAAGRIQTVFIQKHFAELGPPGPGFAGDLIVDFIAEFSIEWRLVQSGKFLVELGAEYFVLGHEVLFLVRENYLTMRRMWFRATPIEMRHQDKIKGSAG